MVEARVVGGACFLTGLWSIGSHIVLFVAAPWNMLTPPVPVCTLAKYWQRHFTKSMFNAKLTNLKSQQLEHHHLFILSSSHHYVCPKQQRKQQQWWQQQWHIVCTSQPNPWVSICWVAWSPLQLVRPEHWHSPSQPVWPEPYRRAPGFGCGDYWWRAFAFSHRGAGGPWILPQIEFMENSLRKEFPLRLPAVVNKDLVKNSSLCSGDSPVIIHQREEWMQQAGVLTSLLVGLFLSNDISPISWPNICKYVRLGMQS